MSKVSEDIVSLVGPNGYLLEQREQQIRENFIAENGSLALEIIDGEETTAPSVKEAVSSLPFLAPKKLVVIKRLGQNKQIADDLTDILDSKNDQTQLVIVEPRIDKRGSYYKNLKKLSKLEEFKEQKEGDLARWIINFTKAKGVNISFTDANFLVERIGPNQMTLVKELTKLIIFEPNITRSNIEDLTEPSPKGTIFNLLDSAFSKNYKKTIELYDSLRVQKVEPQNILAMIVWQLHIVALVEASKKPPDTVARESGFHPFVVEKSSKIARLVGRTRIKSLLAELCEIDLTIKSQMIDPDEVLKEFLFELG